MVFLVRHGESEWNVAYKELGKDPGIRDAPLTETGHRQVAETAQRLRDEKHDLRRIVASPLTRALQTAHILAEALDLPVTVEPLVVEQIWFSCDEGTPRSELADAWPHLDFEHLDEYWWGPLTETEAQMLKRCARFRTLMAEAHDWPHVVVASHWAFIKGLTGNDTVNAGMVRFDPNAEPHKPDTALGEPGGGL